MRQVLEKSDTDKQYAEKNLHVSKSIEDDIVKEAFDKNNNLDDKDMNVEFVGK